MTQSVTIVNTSNWKNEDISVNDVILEPGEKHTLLLTSDDAVLDIKKVDETSKSKPFYNSYINEEGKLSFKQVIPVVNVSLK